MSEAEAATKSGLSLDPIFTIHRYRAGAHQATIRPTLLNASASMKACAWRGAGGVSTSSCQFAEQHLRLLQVARIKPFHEPNVDRSEQIASLGPLAVIAPWRAKSS